MPREIFQGQSVHHMHLLGVNKMSLFLSVYLCVFCVHYCVVYVQTFDLPPLEKHRTVKTEELEKQRRIDEKL